MTKKYTMRCFACREDKEPKCFTKQEPVYCCSGRDCGCMGQSIEPPICDACLEKGPTNERL